MPDVIQLRGRNRSPADADLDLPACGAEWGPRGCPASGRQQRHACWTWTGWPHVCRCLRCNRAPDRWKTGDDHG